MRRILLASALFVGMAVLSQSTAQQPDPEVFKVMRVAGQVFFSHPAALANNAGVQKELKMDEEQVKAAREKVVMPGFGFGGGFRGGKGGKGGKGGFDLTDEQKERIAKYMEKLSSLKDTPEDQLEAKIRETFKDELEAPTKEVEKILKPEQLSRLKQIARQQGGPGAYLKPENVTDLKVTDEQKKKIKDINDELQKDTQELRRSAGGGKGGFGPLPPETQQKITALTKEASEKAAEVLTAEQKTKWKELTGEPYTVEFGFGRRPPKKDD
jgi:Spy/CpxP family protein refolding chaperone